MKGQPKPDGPIVENYVVTCIDVLGQRERLEEFPALILSPTADDIDRVTKAVNDTYGRVHAVRTLLHSLLKEPDTRATDSDWYKSLSPEGTEEFHRMRDYDMECQQYSDTVVFYAPLRNKRGALSLMPVVSMLWACAMSMLINLGRKIAIRGAIEIGAALSLPEFGIYGSAYYSAYDLESSVAGYPRVVIGHNLLEYLRKWEETGEADRLSRLNRRLVEYSIQMMCEDVDGRWIVDFLNEGLPVLFGPDKDEKTSSFLQEQREKGFNFVVAELERCKRDRRSDLAFRYAHLLDYYAVRSGNHGDENGMPHGGKSMSPEAP